VRRHFRLVELVAREVRGGEQKMAFARDPYSDKEAVKGV
jgi:hypothetical protein